MLVVAADAVQDSSVFTKLDNVIIDAKQDPTLDDANLDRFGLYGTLNDFDICEENVRSRRAWYIRLGEDIMVMIVV